ncbi:carbon storage regulator [Fuerstiella marisgermanici]|uniref:Translational regulator CsrA n=1 Tax=Fuerstiella marisgermanici TaxID=1891926 RepID=A0A1P8WL99_9PLAN|nr:hypothetical protein Fuma_04474 [Fuerstiella marisgermanici]
MLVLTRKPGQSVQIADNVTVSILSSSGNRVRLGITAPQEQPIRRTNRKPKKGSRHAHRARHR